MTEKLTEAIKEGNVEDVRKLLSANPGIVRAMDGISPILLSIYMGKQDIVIMLIDAVDQLSLHEAAASGDSARLEEILGDQPDRINEYGNDGFTPLGLAAYFGHTEIVAMLLRRHADVNLPSDNAQHVAPLHSAVSAKHNAIINLLLEHGGDVNARQAGDITPLMQAAHHGDAALVERLLKLGADPAAKTNEGHDAMWYAKDISSDAVIEVLTMHASHG